MIEKNKTKLMWVIVIVVVIGAAIFAFTQNSRPGKYDEFAQCLGESGAKFYGAFWCQHCQNQKAMFGRAVKNLPYIECSTPEGQSQLQVCKDAGVTSYPTWIFADGSLINGEAQLTELAEKTGCELPQ